MQHHFLTNLWVNLINCGIQELGQKMWVQNCKQSGVILPVSSFIELLQSVGLLFTFWLASTSMWYIYIWVTSVDHFSDPHLRSLPNDSAARDQYMAEMGGIAQQRWEALHNRGRHCTTEMGGIYSRDERHHIVDVWGITWITNWGIPILWRGHRDRRHYRVESDSIAWQTEVISEKRWEALYSTNERHFIQHGWEASYNRVRGLA